MPAVLVQQSAKLNVQYQIENDERWIFKNTLSIEHGAASNPCKSSREGLEHPILSPVYIYNIYIYIISWVI